MLFSWRYEERTKNRLSVPRPPASRRHIDPDQCGLAYQRVPVASARSEAGSRERRLTVALLPLDTRRWWALLDPSPSVMRSGFVVSKRTPTSLACCKSGQCASPTSNARSRGRGPADVGRRHCHVPRGGADRWPLQCRGSVGHPRNEDTRVAMASVMQAADAARVCRPHG